MTRLLVAGALAALLGALGGAGVGAAGIPSASPQAYLLGRQLADGGFAEPGAASTPGLTAWAVLGLRAGGPPRAPWR